MDQTFYAVRSDGSICSFTGMTQDVITAMLKAQGLTCTWTDQKTYMATLQKNRDDAKAVFAAAVAGIKPAAVPVAAVAVDPGQADQLQAESLGLTPPNP